MLFAIALGITITALSPLSTRRAAAQSGDNASRKIAFERNEEIFLMNGDGSNQTSLGTGLDPAWSPDAQKLAFTFPETVETTGIYVMNADGTGLVQLTDSGNDFTPSWSPDGTRIAFTSYRVGEPPNGSPNRIYVMNADGSNQQKVFANSPSGLVTESQPVWSPDGTKLAFIGQASVNGLSKVDVYLVNVDGTGLVRLTNVGNIPLATTLAWSPDGSKIAFTSSRDIQTIAADGTGVPINLTNSTASDDTHPSYTSDGTKIVYSSNNFGDNSLDGIYVMNADGTGATFTGAAGRDPQWKPEAVVAPTPTPTPTPTPSPTPTPQADLSVLLTASPNQPTIGSNLFYTLVVTNHGPDAATGVTAFFTRPQGLDLVSASPAVGSCQPSQQTPLGTVCQLGNLASGSQVSVNIVTKPTAAGEITAFSSATSALDDPEQNNNAQSLKLTVAPPAPCVEEVTSIVGQLVERPGNQSRKQVRHVIYVRNNSGRQLNGLVHFVFDGLPASIEGDKKTSFFRTRCSEPLGRKYTSVGVGVNALVWEPGQVIKLEVDFFNPERELINYNLRIYTGPGFP
jgi:uncharacterized repeat protein (TIGR01451 family)